MSTYVAYRDGGRTNEEGLFKSIYRLFTKGVPLIDSSTSMQVVQRSAGANMSVDISVGDVSFHFPSATYGLWAWQDAVSNVSVSSANPTNPRIDVVYAYVDLSVVNPALDNNPGALKFGVYAGTPAGSPSAPSDSAIQTLLGAGVPFVKLAQISVAAAATQVVNANITDYRYPIAFKGRLWGGSSNTRGHTIPNVADDEVVLKDAVQTLTNKSLGSISLDTPDITNWTGWMGTLNAPASVTNNGNGSYDLVFSGVNYTSKISVGDRIRTTRTVAAPTRCTSLDGSTQYFNDTSLSGMSYTDDSVAGAWIKIPSYTGTTQTIISRFNGTSGWYLVLDSAGRVSFYGHNGGGGNYSGVKSYHTVPVNKWVFVTAQLDMSAFTATSTTSYVMFNGVEVPAFVERAGTNPTTLTQAGNLEIGSQNGGTALFFGKIAQAFVTSAKVTQANVRTLMSQGITSSQVSTHSMVSAYSFDNTANDLNTTNANNLSPQGSATTTNADSPFGGQADRTISSTLDYGIVQKVSFSTDTTITVQVPEGCTIPTSGGVSTIVYSVVKAPYGFPAQEAKWVLETVTAAASSISGLGAASTTNPNNRSIYAPVGEWMLGFQTPLYYSAAGTVGFCGISTSASSISYPSGLSLSNSTGKTASGNATGIHSVIRGDGIPLTITSAQQLYAFLRNDSGLSKDYAYVDNETAAYIRLKNAYV